MNKEAYKNHYDEKLWKMCEYFFSAATVFREMFSLYRDKVSRFSKDRGVQRNDLRLSADEISTLFDLHAMERLRDEILFDLKATTHALFRTKDSTDELDRYCSDIFHQVSILKEEHYSVKTYASAYEDREEAGKILDAVHANFPVKLEQIQILFKKARRRVEEILTRENRRKILVRSLYLFGDDLLKPVYSDGLFELYCAIYPSCGPAEGCVVAAKSFMDSSFYEKAAEAIEKAREYLDRDPSICKGQAHIPEKEKTRLSKEIKSLASKLEPYLRANA